MLNQYVFPSLMPKLAIVTQFFPPDYAATGQLLAELANNLGDLGIDVHLFTGQPGYAFNQESAPAKEHLPGLSIRRTRASRIWTRRIRGRTLNGLMFAMRSLIHLARKPNRGDVLLITTEPPYLTAIGYLAHLLWGLPYFCLIYDLYPDIAIELDVIKPEHWLSSFWHQFNKRIWRNAQGIIVLSPTMKERLITHCPEVHKRVHVIHSWADPDCIKPIPKQDNWFAHQLGLVDKFVVMYSGNMGRCHDLDTIIDAATYLQDENIEFVFIGNGAKKDQAMQRVNELQLTNIRFLPYQEKSALPYSLTACDVSLVSVSKGMEGLIAPSKLYGILASGRPVGIVCESHSYLREILAEANCGQAFNQGDGEGLAKFIQDLANNPYYAQKLGHTGRQYLESRFTPEIIAQQYLEALNLD